MSRKMFTSMLARIIDGVLCAATSFITGVRPKQPQQLDCPSEGTVFYANHNSHGDFVLVWISLPKRWRIHARPVAGADYWLRGRLRRFVIEEVFRGLLVERQGGDPQQMIAQMDEALQQGDSLIIFPRARATPATKCVCCRLKAAFTTWPRRIRARLLCRCGSTISTACCPKAACCRCRCCVKWRWGRRFI